MTVKTYNVEGMTCGHCKAAVEEKLNDLSGVDHSNADVEKDTVEVRYDDSRVDETEIKAAIERAGYTVAA